ncbi:MAG: hypothetical protein IJQ67_03340 [Bacilli bacterium]|nr:hypothetical protein [Bacilli bacterium]
MKFNKLLILASSMLLALSACNAKPSGKSEESKESFTSCEVSEESTPVEESVPVEESSEDTPVSEESLPSEESVPAEESDLTPVSEEESESAEGSEEEPSSEEAPKSEEESEEHHEDESEEDPTHEESHPADASEEESIIEESSVEESLPELLSEEGEEVPLYENEGESENFPSDVVAEFIDFYGLSYEVPAIESGNPWTYEAGEDTTYGYAIMFLDTIDEGEIGVDSLEDQYLTVLGNLGIEVIDEYYDYFGYMVTDEDTGDTFYFYTNEGYFTIELYGPAYYEGEKVSEVFPVNALKNYLTLSGLETDVPSITSEYEWKYGTYEDEEDGSTYFQVGTKDYGTPGVDAIEDAYSKVLTADGWTIDDSSYDEDGYYALKGDVELLYFSYDEEFWLTVYAYTGDVLPEPSELNPYCMDLSTEDNITGGKNANVTIWSTGLFNMTVAKGSSNIAVGNGTFFSDPLRLYDKQVVSFSWSEGAPVAIVIEAVEDGKAKVQNLLDSAIVGASIDHEDEFVTLTLNDDAEEVAITISGQVRFASVTFVVEE